MNITNKKTSTEVMRISCLVMLYEQLVCVVFCLGFYVTKVL